MKTKIRIARATNDIDRVSKMYSEGLGLNIIDSFRDHEGFDGVMLGSDGVDYHFEFTYEHGHSAPHSISAEQLVVFYVGNVERTEELKNSMVKAGFKIVKSHNPYWDKVGYTLEDFEDYRVTLCNRDWSV